MDIRAGQIWERPRFNYEIGVTWHILRVDDDGWTKVEQYFGDAVPYRRVFYEYARNISTFLTRHAWRLIAGVGTRCKHTEAAAHALGTIGRIFADIFADPVVGRGMMLEFD